MCCLYELNNKHNIQVVLASSDELFVLYQLKSISGIRGDKFNVLHLNQTYKGLQEFLEKVNENRKEDTKLSKEAISLVLSYHNNKRDMQDAINAYNAEKQKSKNEQQALMKMKETLIQEVLKAKNKLASAKAKISE